jgi:hypothetical protein
MRTNQGPSENSNRAGERQHDVFKKRTVFTIPLPCHPRNPAATPSHRIFAQVCAAGITGSMVKNRANPSANRQRFLNVKCRY